MWKRRVEKESEDDVEKESEDYEEEDNEEIDGDRSVMRLLGGT